MPVEEHEPELRDSDDYERPLSNKKFKTIVWSFVILGLIAGLYQGIVYLMT